MRIAHLFFCLFALPAFLQAQETLPLFASRDTEVELINTEGVSLQAVINDVWPERQSTRIFVREQGSSFTLPLETFSENSQALIQDWFFKRLASLNLSFKVEERMLGRGERQQNPETMPTPHSTAFNARATDQLREKDVSVEIRNSSNYKQQGLTVTIGLRIARDITSYSGAKQRLERTVRSVQRNVTVPSGGSVIIESPPVVLSNYTLRYDSQVQVTDYLGRSWFEKRSYRSQAVDRIFGYYVLVHYKGELVAATVSQQYLVRELLAEKQAKEEEENPPPSTSSDIEVFEGDFHIPNPAKEQLDRMSPSRLPEQPREWRVERSNRRLIIQ